MLFYICPGDNTDPSEAFHADNPNGVHDALVRLRESSPGSDLVIHLLTKDSNGETTYDEDKVIGHEEDIPTAEELALEYSAELKEYEESILTGGE